MSREDPIIVRISTPTVARRASPETKRAIRDADIVISSERIVLKDRQGLAGRRATDEEIAKARTA